MSPIHWFLVPFLLTLPLVVAWFQRHATPERSAERRRLARWTFAFLALMLLLAGIDARFCDSLRDLGSQLDAVRAAGLRD